MEAPLDVPADPPSKMMFFVMLAVVVPDGNVIDAEVLLPLDVADTSRLCVAPLHDPPLNVPWQALSTAIAKPPPVTTGFCIVKVWPVSADALIMNEIRASRELPAPTVNGPEKLSPSPLPFETTCT